MVKFDRLSARVLAVAAFAVLALALAACGSSSSSSSSTSSTGGTSSSGGNVKDGGSATVVMGTAPDYLDPSEGYTTQSAEATWIVYTGLLTYKHLSGEAGGELIPGLATALPTISSDGKTYTLTL